MKVRFLNLDGPVPHLCDTKWDVAHIEPAGLPGHLAAHYRYRGGSNCQAIWSHGRQEGCGWNLARSWRAKRKVRLKNLIIYI